VVIEWPKGGRLSVSRPASIAQLSLVVRSERDWFSLSGQLRAEEGMTVEMQRLLALLDATPGRFIPLGEGQFLALTRELRRRLEDLRSLSEPQGRKLRVHAVAAPALDELAGAAGAFKSDAGWRELLARIREAQALEPEVPSTLQAELRDYQLEGYRWLSRLAHWGAGACLADDMGLGKTVQALALLLARAAEGPALVVAPTSVGLNWAAETARFAPTLSVKMFGGVGEERRALAEGLGPFDVLVTSYDLMQREEALLTGRRWHTIVLDEAQAIKNMATRRSKAAMKLQGGFRMITTGTPIENHLGELWNLFRFLNPGLLGSLERFNERFAGPIERQQDREARVRLRKLLHPFILRRTRAQVLEELPPRTEIQREVVPEQEESAFYEALRRTALERLERAEGPAEQRRFQILAEIMRLRRACCNPRLVAPDIDVPSAKLEAFGELVEELRDNGHKALVFSQFTDHLALVREYLDARGVIYQYLDGTMPPEARQRAIAAFQAGRGDLFLISLKAGGTGLNLTAADYVIHLDPWWNPAVEDQATGRAHRIGQERPVTVYRLVARGTIEQKIVELHRHKRDLADSLLEGTEAARRLSPEELLALLREG
jgi:SNF2 family DNA or RNA helicase